MTREEAREFAEVIMHYANGGEVEMNSYVCVPGHPDNVWDVQSDPQFRGPHICYRIKVE